MACETITGVLSKDELAILAQYVRWLVVHDDVNTLEEVHTIISKDYGGKVTREDVNLAISGRWKDSSKKKTKDAREQVLRDIKELATLFDRIEAAKNKILSLPKGQHRRIRPQKEKIKKDLAKMEAIWQRQFTDKKSDQWRQVASLIEDLTKSLIPALDVVSTFRGLGESPVAKILREVDVDGFNNLQEAIDFRRDLIALGNLHDEHIQIADGFAKLSLLKNNVFTGKMTQEEAVNDPDYQVWDALLNERKIKKTPEHAALVAARVAKAKAEADIRTKLKDIGGDTGVDPSQKWRDLATASRTILATADWSGILRQGWLLLSGSLFDPDRRSGLGQALVRSAKAFANELRGGDLARTYDLELRTMPEQAKRDMSGLYLAKSAATNINEAEENFSNNSVRRTPIFGRLVDASEAHMATFLNILRATAFDSYARANPDASTGELMAYAHFINTATGRGGGRRLSADAVDKGLVTQAEFDAHERRRLKLEETLNALNVTLFSPRFSFSRFQSLSQLFKSSFVAVGTSNTGLKYKGLDRAESKRVARAIAKDLYASLVTGMTTLGIAASAGLSIGGEDPEDSDWGRIVLSDGTRIDVWAGEQQVMRFTLSILRRAVGNLGERVGMALGEKEAAKIAKEIAPDSDRTSFEVMQNFIKYKLNPTLSLPWQIIDGKNAVGQDVGMMELFLGNFTPIVVQEMAGGILANAWPDVFSTHDPIQTVGDFAASAARTTGEGLGLGVNQYGSANRLPDMKRVLKAADYEPRYFRSNPVDENGDPMNPSRWRATKELINKRSRIETLDLLNNPSITGVDGGWEKAIEELPQEDLNELVKDARRDVLSVFKAELEDEGFTIR